MQYPESNTYLPTPFLNPNSSHSEQPDGLTTENCAAISYLDGKWNDLNCVTQQNVVCMKRLINNGISAQVERIRKITEMIVIR